MEEDVLKVMESLPESSLRTETFTPESLCVNYPQAERATWLKVMSQNWGQLHSMPG